MSPQLQLVRAEHGDPETVVTTENPATVAYEQAIDAIDAIRRPASEYLHMPWPELDNAVGGIPPGDLWYVGGFSGDGKTTMLTSLVLDGVSLGWRVYYLGLESRAHVIRTHFACKTLGLDAGDLLSGAYHAWGNAPEVRESVRAELKRQMLTEAASTLRVSEAASLTAAVVRQEYLQAAALGSTVVVVDHVDHLADAQNAKQASDAVNAEILTWTQQLGVVTIAASQLNLDTIRGNRALRYMPVRETYFKFGNKKRELASGMLGIYRPLRLDGLEKGELQRLREGELEARDVCEPHTMALNVVKHRLYGQREGMRVLLGVRQGRVVERPARLPHSLR